jgi:flagellar protein FlaH
MQEEITVTKITSNPFISSGNAELDAKMGGGIPVGALTLVEGASGSGKSVFVQQLTWGALQDGRQAVVFTSENTVKSLVKQMKSINLDVLDFLLLRRLRVFTMQLARLHERALPTLLSTLQQYTWVYEDGKNNCDLIVVDSWSSAVTAELTPSDILSYFETCQTICSRGVTIVNVLHANKLPDQLTDQIRSMSDAHFRLHSQQDGQRMVKTLEVAKVRGAGGSTGNIVGFDVEPGWGMRVIPISKARG